MKLPFVCAIFAVGALCAPTKSASRVVHEERHNAGRWKRTPTVDKTAIVPVRIGLAQRNLHAGYDHVMSV
jgi:tripeptidyl-peptidase-1